ncbi:hypothetical protein V2J09_016750 [Rumex salicifolius]
MSEAENSSHFTDKAEHLDQSGYDPFLEKCRNNLESPASEQIKKFSGLIHNDISQQTRLGDASYVSSSGRSVQDSDRNSNYGQLVKEPLCEADWEGLLFYPIPNIDVQSFTEQQKECIHPGENPAGHSHDHGYDKINNFENIAGASDKSSADTVPGQLTNNYVELSNLKQSDEGIYRIPENIAGEYIKVSNYDPKDLLEPSPQEITKQIILDHAEALPDATSKGINCQYQVVLALQSSANTYAQLNEASIKRKAAALKSSTLYGNKTCRRSGAWVRKTPATKVKSEYTLRSSSGGRRSPNPGIQEKIAASEPDKIVDNSHDGKKRGRKKRYHNRKLHDEFSKMKIHLKYLLHRMRYEQNLIDAYSSEGWRGQSLEKLRPEKELLRAMLDINRSKLKIRGLFQHIDVICAEGRFPESLFNSEGLMDSEDIFCAKCGSKDLSLDNDIILCDGLCDRGFHQLCLDPPLRTTDIPPGDEVWLCPACDCKFDCIQLLNDSAGTKVSNSDSWEHVFPEAAKTGNTMEDSSALPSDDSEDDDYNPDGVDDDQDHNDDDMVGHESASDESDFSPPSEDFRTIQMQKNEEQYLGLPSDDSKDDDYNPNFAHTEEQLKQESSSSDFTSASEDLHPVTTNDEVSSKYEPLMSPSQLVQELDGSSPVSGRRKVERLDYKKLYDETYGSTWTDSSEDEDWKDALTPNRRKNGRRNMSLQSTEGEEREDALTPKRRRYSTRNASSLKSSDDSTVDAGGISNVAGDTSTTSKAPLSPKHGIPNISETSKTSSGGKKQPYKKLGEEVTQRLYASFKENQYPDRSTKDNLAAELGISPKQVNKWFGNARWSFKHSSVQDASASGAVSKEVDKATDDGNLPFNEHGVVISKRLQQLKLKEKSDCSMMLRTLDSSRTCNAINDTMKHSNIKKIK